MDNIYTFSLFLFDFDGLIVDTERLHYKAYMDVFKRRGIDFQLDFPAYYQIASTGGAPFLKQAVLDHCPDLSEESLQFDELYEEKKQYYQSLLEKEDVVLMKGVESFLTSLLDQKKKVAIVTHSFKKQVMYIRDKHPLLQKIDVWFTREDYKNPKPAPDGYLKALEMFQEKGERTVGFEDSPRGVQALLGAHVVPVMINEIEVEGKEQLQQRGVAMYSSFEELIKNFDSNPN